MAPCSSRTRAVPARHQHGHRPGRRLARRIFPPLLLDCSARHHRRVVAGLPAAVTDRAGAVAGQSAHFSPGGRPARCAARRGTAGWGSRPRRSVAAGVTLQLAAAVVVGSRNLAHFDAALAVHVCDVVRRVRYHLSLRDVARSPADTALLASGLAGVLRADSRRAIPRVSASARRWRWRPTASSSRDRCCAAPRTG